MLAGDVYAVTQGTGNDSINDTLFHELSAQPWAQLVSGEIFAVGTLHGTPVVVRGANASVFVAMEGGTWVEQTPAPTHWAVAGTGLRDRLGLSLREYVTLEGSSVPRLTLVPLVGVFRSANVANDELVVDLGTARFLTGAAAWAYHSIRVETAQPDALVSFLTSAGASAWVSGPRGVVAGINTGAGLDPRVVNVVLRLGTGALPADYLAAGIEEVSISVRVVVLGLAVLIGLLVALGIHATQARAFEDRRAAVGVLRAVGAGNRWMRARSLLETLPLAVVAGVVGGLLGFLVDAYAGSALPALAFGHEIRVAFDPITFALFLVGVVAISSLSQLILLQRALKDKPGESIRGEPTLQTPPSLEVVLRG